MRDHPRLFNYFIKSIFLFIINIINNFNSLEMLKFLKILRPIIHYSLHLFFPGLIAWVFFRENWKIAWLIMILTMLIDLDHLLIKPIFNSNRCSIGTHPLHSYYVIIIYFFMLFVPNLYVRIIAVGLLFHMFTDFQNYLWIKFFK